MPRRKGNVTKYKKAPDAPKRFKSAFMFFSEKKHRQIREQAAENDKLLTTDIAKQVSEVWRNLPSNEREDYEEMARKDRERYDREKATYKGPWKVPSAKNPTAPRRPASAFLAFSNERRRQVSQDNPKLSSAEISGLLSKMWKEAPADEREKFREEERQRREQYKKDLAEWSDKQLLERKTAEEGHEEHEDGEGDYEITTQKFAAAASAAVASAPTATAAPPQSNPTQAQLQASLTNLPVNIQVGDLLPLLRQALTGTHGSQQQQQEHQVSVSLPPLQPHHQLQQGSHYASSLQRPSETNLGDFTSYATFASSSSAADSHRQQQQQPPPPPPQQQSNSNAATTKNLALFLVAVGLLGRERQEQVLRQQQQQQVFQHQQQQQQQQQLSAALRQAVAALQAAVAPAPPQPQQQPHQPQPSQEDFRKPPAWNLFPGPQARNSNNVPSDLLAALQAAATSWQEEQDRTNQGPHPPPQPQPPRGF